MVEAIDSARRTVGDFIAHLKSPGPNESRFSVKKQFGNDEKGEHIWLDEVKFDVKKFSGVVANEPVEVTGVKMGDPATVEPKEISDWMYVRDGKLVGGTSIRLLYKRASPEEKEPVSSKTSLMRSNDQEHLLAELVKRRRAP
jgi:uncharacterized protein YegJ (DUF2314 family)